MPAGSSVPGTLFSSWATSDRVSVAGSRGLGTAEVRTADRKAFVPIKAATRNLFPLLGVRAQVGRTFKPSGEDAGERPVVLAYRLWQTLFDGRSDVVGQPLWIDDRPYTVIGVLPPRFWIEDMASPVWRPLDVATLTPDIGVDTVARRNPGQTSDMLAAELQATLPEYVAGLPAGQRELKLKVSGIEGTPIGRQMSLILPYILGASVFLVLLIACANVAILMIVQWTSRERETAIRASIGASRARLVRGLLTESTLLAAIGGVLGVAVTFAVRGWVVSLAGSLAFYDLSIDPWLLLQIGTLTLATGIVVGLAPALFETGRLGSNPLRSVAGSDRIRQRWRHVLVVFEITVTVALLVETMSMVDGYRRARQGDMGFITAPLLTLRLDSPGGVLVDHALEELRSVPGVAGVAISTGVPFGVAAPQVTAGNAPEGGSTLMVSRIDITPEFFDVMGIPLRAGRRFSHDDASESSAVLINEALAQKLFAGSSAVGGRVWIARAPYDVIGVVANYANSPLRPLDQVLRVFVRIPDSATPHRAQFVVRAANSASALTDPMRRKALSLAAGSAVTGVDTFDQVLDVIGQEILVGTAPLFPLIAIGLFLTASGIYGVLAFAVTRRAHELAIRIAVGATSADVTKLVGGHALGVVSAGALLGTGLTFVLSRIVRFSGGAGSIFDPGLPAFVLPMCVVGVVAALAMWVPSRRAQRIDPAMLLKAD
jgi:predicted permease